MFYSKKTIGSSTNFINSYYNYSKDEFYWLSVLEDLFCNKENLNGKCPNFISNYVVQRLQLNEQNTKTRYSLVV